MQGVSAVRVGTDLVSVEAVQASIRSHADRYLERIYTAREIAECRAPDGPVAERLAGRFAAKEAMIKVLEPGPGDPIPWRSIELTSAGPGAPRIALSGRSAELADAAGITGHAVTVAHQGDLAIATVVATIGEDR